MSEPGNDVPSPGAMLRAAREKQGLHIAALAAAIKVSPRKLDALEHDRWHELPDATFTRALAQTVCRTLKVDAKPILDKLPSAVAVSLDAADTGLNEPFRDRPGREEPGLAAAAVRPMVWGAGLLLVTAVLVYVLPLDLWSRAPAKVASPPAAPAVVEVPLPASAVAAAAAPPGLPLLPLLPLFPPAAPDGLASAPVAAAEPVFAAPAPAPAPAPAAPAAAVAVASAVPVAGAASALVQLRTSASSWVQARDGRGAMLLSRMVRPGESLGLDGELPIRLTIGNAAATQLAFRGQAVDLTARTRDNVARVELQ